MVRRNYTEDDVAEAILDTTDRGLSQNEAAQKRGVPQSTLSGRLSGQASRNERIQAHQRIPKSQEETLIRWVLRQESLGYAPSHSQLRACVEAILKQQGDNKPLGKHWTTRFVKRHLELSTKLGKRQEAARFDGFTPKAVNWYFDIRENEYGWIKPENTVNVDEGGIMVGFGLDSLVIGSSDPKKKAMLKGVQSRTWTSFIEAVTATGRALKPGIIFKGKELQKQWFLNEFELIADWHYITSPNGWTDNHIALEWLKDVYLPQTEPRDASDARLIILDGHGSHAQDEWMATCFLNNVYCCYLPAHCSHGLQPLDNGIFNVIKGAYRKELQKLASLTDSAPVDKVHFIRAYAKAREAGMRKDIILSGWRFTGNWPINRHKALTHPEIQPDKEKVPERFKTPSPPQLHSDDTPKTSRQVRDLAKHRSRPTRRKYSKIAKGLEALEMKVAVQNARITGLEEQMAQVRRGKKRKAVPNPNRRFMALAETLTAGEALPDSKKAEIEVDVDEKDESVIEILYPAVIFGSIAAGGIFTGANPSYTYSELVNQLTVSGAKCIVTDSPRLEMAKKAAEAAGLPPNSLVLIDSKDSSAVGGVSSFQSLLGYGTYSWERISNPKVLADKPAVLNFSSGTTGLPKACEITHRNLVANAEQNLHLDRVARKRKNDPTFAANDVHCAFLPFYHAMGLITFCILNVKRGCTTVVMPKFDLKSFLSTIQDFKVTYLILAPPVVSMLVKSPLVCQYDLSSVKFLVCGAAPLQADVEKRLEALFSKTGARSRQGWGMSEATMSISIFGPDEFDPSHGSVGYLVANMQLQIIDENGKALGYDEEGEAILRGPNMFKGYYKNPAATKEAFTDDGWVKTGDIVKIDRTGLVTIVDRKKELIKVKGFQVAPSELEGHLLEHEGVLDCAVIRVLRNGQEHPQAHVVRKKPGATAESILSFMDKRLSPVKRITGGIVFTDAIPKSRSGKILRRLIKDGFASKDPSPRL
ncbi:putative acyl-coenzyme A synthetase [Fusarium oxysporum f. sp. conglutinans]|nr:putative acyl-coenzyme A synthetase [Fusarium oxysporum f. sp. conglutinans]